MRKHHNKLYYGKYPCKVMFKIPYSNALWPTTDEHLQHIIDKNHVTIELCNFILKNRSKMKFRNQETKTIFYCDEKMEQTLIKIFRKYYKGSKNIDPRFKDLAKDSIGCKILPHGKFQYQVHLKKDIDGRLNKEQRSALWDFLARNKDNCKLTSRDAIGFLSAEWQYFTGGYFYVTEEKYLTPIYMIASKGIDKIIKFVKI